MLNNLTIVFLSFNEEKNLPDAIESVQGISSKKLAVDSFSTDSTLDILKKANISCIQHEFINYALQRNWAQLQVETQWVLHLDADERLTPEFRSWLENSFPKLSEQYDGFLFSRRTIFMNRWIKHGGHYPNFHLRLFKTNAVKCEEKAYDQHFVDITNGKYLTVKNADIINVVSESLTAFTAQHNKWATSEANEIVSSQIHLTDVVQPRFFGSSIERRRWLKSKIFMKTPLFVRPLAYFLYRYFIRLGFMDGKQGLVFHFLQGFWFRFLVDAKVYELKKESSQREKP